MCIAHCQLYELYIAHDVLYELCIALNILYELCIANAQYYGRSRQCGRPVGARCSMGLGRNLLINGLIQHTFNLNFLFVEKFTVIPFD